MRLSPAGIIWVSHIAVSFLLSASRLCPVMIRLKIVLQVTATQYESIIISAASIPCRQFSLPNDSFPVASIVQRLVVSSSPLYSSSWSFVSQLNNSVVPSSSCIVDDLECSRPLNRRRRAALLMYMKSAKRTARYSTVHVNTFFGEMWNGTGTADIVYFSQKFRLEFALCLEWSKTPGRQPAIQMVLKHGINNTPQVSDMCDP